MAYKYTISQMLIYNTYSTYHNTKTTTIRNSKEHETPFLLYQGLNMHGDARLRTKNRSRIPTNLGGGGVWQREDNDIWLSHWTTLNDASKSCSLLLHCGCARSVNVAELECIHGTGLCKSTKSVFIHNPMTFGFVVVTKSNNEWWPSWI